MEYSDARRANIMTRAFTLLQQNNRNAGLVCLPRAMLAELHGHIQRVEEYMPVLDELERIWLSIRDDVRRVYIGQQRLPTQNEMLDHLWAHVGNIDLELLSVWLSLSDAEQKGLMLDVVKLWGVD